MQKDESNYSSRLEALEKQNKEYEKLIADLRMQTKAVGSISNSYFVILHADLVNRTYNFITDNEILHPQESKKDGFWEDCKYCIGKTVAPEYQQKVLDFMDYQTIAYRMRNVDEVNCDYQHTVRGWCRMSIRAARRSDDGWLEAVVITARVIDEERRQQRIIEKIKEQMQATKGKNYLSHRDIMTGLINRNGFELLVSTIDSDEEIAFILLDVDYLRNINDVYGRSSGDEAVIRVANHLTRKFRHTDTCIRWGGDSFAVVLRNLELNNFGFILEKIKSLNNELATGKCPISISAGIVFSKSGFHGDLISCAEDALHYVKTHGRCGYMLYDDIKDTEHPVPIICSNDADYDEEFGNARSWYSEELFYEYNNFEEIVDNQQRYIDMVLGSNRAVGVLSCYLDDGLPIYSVSGFALKSLYYTFDEFHNKTGGKFLGLIHEEDREIFLKCIKEPVVSTFKARLLNKNGGYHWFEFINITVKAHDGRNVFFASLRCVDEVLVGDMCTKDYELIGLINTGDGSLVMHKDELLRDTAMTDGSNIFNYSERLRYAIENYIRPEEALAVANNLCLENVISQLEKNGLFEYIAYFRRGVDKYVAIRHKFRYLSKLRGLIFFTEENVADWAEHDSLTGLYNEEGFSRHVEELLKKDGESHKYAICFFDIKEFKAINAALGDVGGDTVLKSVGQAILNSDLKPLRTARFNGDHFFALVEAKNLSEQNILNACVNQVVLNTSLLPLCMHCGITIIEDTTKAVRMYCDAALLAAYNISPSDSQPYKYFDDEMRKEYLDKVDILDSLPRALINNEFCVYYQPIYDAKTKKLVSAEALVRWMHPEKGVISPGIFIPTLEKNGHIALLDLFVHRHVVAFMDQRFKDGQHFVPVSMNLSRTDFMNNKMVDQLMESVEQASFPRNYMKFEITESAFVDIGKYGATVLEKLRYFDCDVLLDDFGVGASSLSSLIDRSFDIVKLDMSFVRNIGKNERSEAIIHASIVMAHKMGSRVVGEGVETQEQYDFLRDAGCDLIQGYYFSKPLPEADFAKLLDQE